MANFFFAFKGVLFLLALLSISLIGAVDVKSREKGWVPISPPDQIHLLKPGTPAKATKAIPPQRKQKINPIPKKSTRLTGTVYDDQPPVTEKELNTFVVLLPQFRIWARKNGEEAHPVVNPEGNPDFLYSVKAANWVEEHNFDAPRFFCIMGRMAAGLVIVEEGNDLKGTRPADMPSVAPQELGLVRKHLGALLTAGGPPQPIK